MKRLLAGLAVFYGLGIILADLIRLDFWLITGVAVAVFILASLGRSNKYLFLPLFLFLALLAGCLSLKNSYRLSGCHIRNFVSYNHSIIYNVKGFISSVPELKYGRYWFSLRAREIQVDRLRYKCCGELLVKMDFARELNYGENLTLIGNLNRLYSFNRASQGYQDYLARQGIYLTMSIKDSRQIVRPGGFSGAKLIKSCFWLRAYLEQVISRHLPALPASILSAMVLGQKRDIPWLVNNSMVKSGTVHILVVSGFNVGIVAFIINLLLKILRFPHKARIILTAVCLLVYCWVTGATNPVIRATVMGLVYLMAYFLKREPDIYNSLVSAALFILVINPRQLFDIGFQLSFVSVLAIVYLYPKLKSLTRLEACKIKILKFIGEGCLVSFSAWLGTLVIIALNFRIIAPVTVLANILIVPLATLITLCGFTLVLSGLIYPDLANLLSLPTAGVITLLLNINAALIKLPFAYIYF
ncbi:MAG: ComEC/Rec2 family competence protein [Candidatus Omnitrophota bacterium]